MEMYLLSIIIAMIVIAIVKNQSKGERLNNKLDKVGAIFNIVLSILYIPLSYISIMMVMVSDVFSANQLYNNLISIFCYITITFPLICIISIALSVILRIKGKSIASFRIQFLPLVVFTLNMIFIVSVDKIFN